MKKMYAYNTALLEATIENKFECPECGDAPQKLTNGPPNEVTGYCCSKCGWQDYTDLGPIEVELRGYRFSIGQPDFSSSIKT